MFHGSMGRNGRLGSLGGRSEPHRAKKLPSIFSWYYCMDGTDLNPVAMVGYST